MTDSTAFRSITGAGESAEPASSTAPQPAAASTRDPAANRTATAPSPPLRATAAASDSGTAAMRQQVLSGTRSLNVSGSPSTANSPLSSRDTSPARPPQRSPGAPGTQTKPSLRSKKSSSDVSPSRGPSLAGSSSTVPSAAAIQRALSSANIPQLQPASSQEPPSRVPRPSKSTPAPSSGDGTPHWPVSPRLKSPPPPPSSDNRSRSRRNSLRNQHKKPESASTPSIIVQSSSPAPESRIPVKDDSAGSDAEPALPSMKVPARGAGGVAPKLETVQEGSLPATPGSDGLDIQSFESVIQAHKSNEQERNDVTSSKVTEDLSSRSAQHTESGSDSGLKNDKGKMSEQRSASTQRPSMLPSKNSFSSLSTVKPRTETQAPSRNMTVETETVPSVAQATIRDQDRSALGRGDGSLRLKPSNETIRPKKERKAPKRKAPSINSGTGRSSAVSYHHHHLSRPVYGPRSPTTTTSLGSPVSYRSYDDRRSMFTISPPSPDMARGPSAPSPSYKYFYSGTNASARKASSKADVFEQKVANAVDEADSSDSDATFIYESNPPDQQPHRSRHHHSRTPSMTSIASLVDPRLAVRDAHKNPGKKSSMKFANPYSNASADPDADRGDGTIRVGSGRVSGGSHHHHIGRHGQGRGALSHLVMDSDSSMAQSSRVRGPSSRQPSQPNSPRFHNFAVVQGNGNGNGNGKHGEFSSYDIDAEHAADDERTPLISSVRSPRVRTPRRRNSATLRQLERRHRRSGSWCRRFAGCLVLSVLLLVVIFSAVGLVFATTKPLTDVRVREVQNVIASQEEIILDMVVEAVNPNVIGVTIADMDVIVFAKSKHVGSDRWWREHEHNQHPDQEIWPPIKASVGEKTVLVRGNVDEGTDPIEDPEVGEPRTMSLGRIFHFDSPLNFDGSFFKHRLVDSVGEVRLSHPGNKTEAGGTERWEEVLQYPFELIVRGTFKYQLPLSTREHKVPVTASYLYDPDAEKKKLKTLELNKVAQKRRGLSSTAVTSRPWGRFDRRALHLLN